MSDASLSAIHREIARGESGGSGGSGGSSSGGVGGGGGHEVVTRDDVVKALGEARASVPAQERERLAKVYAVFETGRSSNGNGNGEGGGRKKKHESPARKKVSHA